VSVMGWVVGLSWLWVAFLAWASRPDRGSRSCFRYRRGEVRR